MKAAASGGRRRRSRPGGDPGNCPPDGNGCHRRGDPGNRPLPDRVVSRDGGDPSNPPGEGSPEGKKIQHSCLQIKKVFESLSFRMALRMVTNTAKKSHQKYTRIPLLLQAKSIYSANDPLRKRPLISQEDSKI